MPDSIEVVASSEGDGNVPATPPVETPAPSEPTPAPEATPATEPVAPTVPTEPELFDLPDGRKVDAATLANEFKTNFLPEFTRKSQELAALKTGTPPTAPQPAVNPYADPEYVPQNYAEIIQAAKEAALSELAQKETDRIANEQAVETAVATQLAEVKVIDPTVNENQLFLHATKYGFNNLKVAHANMKDMAELAKNVKQQTAADIHKRNDPVSITPGAIGNVPDPSGFENARDYLRSLKT